MLRVGLTGGLGSGKSTVAALLREHGAHVLEADAVARELMQPGQPVYRAIVDAFGPGVVRPDGALDRSRLAALAFEEGRLAELNRLVHPPVIAAQQAWSEALFAQDPEAVAVVESALIFETALDPAQGNAVPGWRDRFDRIILVTAPDELKVARYVARVARAGNCSAEEAARDAERRLRSQIPDPKKIPLADYVLANDASVDQLKSLTAALWKELARLSRQQRPDHGADTVVSGDQTVP
jgi:dephospho-CoA kinase